MPVKGREDQEREEEEEERTMDQKEGRKGGKKRKKKLRSNPSHSLYRQAHLHLISASHIKIS